MEMKLQTSRRNPFAVVFLPFLGRLHRNSFRSGRANGSSLGRLYSRLLFYPIKALSFAPVLGKIEVTVGEQVRSASFDARNRQFSALYFDVFSDGYEPELTTIIDALVPDDGIIFDIGSNWGFFAVFLASRSGFVGHIHAFEPWPSTYSDLTGLVNELQLSKRITCHEVALSDNSGHASMCSPSHSGLAHVSSDGSGRKVRTVSLDTLDLPPPNLIKIDAEGLEEKILNGGLGLLAENRPMLLFENRPSKFGGKECMAVLFMLEQIGYSLFAPQLSPSRGETCQLDLVSISAETRREHARHPNLFACHSTKLDQIKKVADRK